jgi:hypothetical protein
MIWLYVDVDSDCDLSRVTQLTQQPGLEFHLPLHAGDGLQPDHMVL